MKLFCKNKHTQSYYAFVFLMCLLICRQSLVTYGLAVVRKLPLMNTFASLFLVIVYVLLIILAYKKEIWRYTRPRDLIVVYFLICAILFTYIFYPENVQYLESNFGSYIVYCIPAFFIGLCAIEYDSDMFMIITKVSCISIVASYFVLFYQGSMGKQIFDELGQSYSVLPNTLFVLAYFFYVKKPTYLVFSILGVIYALVLGSRGPIVLIVVFILSCLVYKNRKRVLLIVIISILVYIFIESGYYRAVLLQIANFIERMGYSTRIIDLTLAGEVMSHTSGRNDIYVVLLEKIMDRPFVGYGLFGEWRFIHWNAHQLYLEVVFEYGWLLGIVLICSYIVTVFRAFLITYKDELIFYFLMIFIVYVLVQGCMSYSHLRPELFLLLGFAISHRRKMMHHSTYK